MTFTKAIAGSATYDIKAHGHRINDVQVTNQEGGGVIYYGDVPGPPVVIPGVSAESGDGFITLATEADGLKVLEGALVTAASNIGASAVVTNVEGRKVSLSVVNSDTEASFDVTFTPPAVSSTNGHPIQPGETVRFSAGLGTWRNQHGKRLVADATGSSVTISKSFN